MARVNQKRVASSEMELTYADQLRRSALCCLLWEDNCYEDGESVADRIRECIKHLDHDQVYEIVKDVKFGSKLRHTPLYMLLCMAENSMLKKEDVYEIVTRVDDMTEIIAMYLKLFKKGNGKKLPKQLVKGLQMACAKFDEYQYGKYQGKKSEVSTRDVFRLVHPNPDSDKQSELYKKVVDRTLAVPDTWEVALSATDDKKAEWTRLLTENRLGALALLRNLSGMDRCGVDQDIVKETINRTGMTKVLPFQIVAASRHAPDYSNVLEKKFFESLKEYPKLDGGTLILVDKSGSMGDGLSERSELMRVDAAAALASLCKEICEDPYCYVFDDELYPVTSDLRGFSLIREMSQLGGCTAVIDCTNAAIRNYQQKHSGKMPKRVIVVTDEQSNSDRYGTALTKLPNTSKGYMINVDNYEQGVNTSSGNWKTISGWSDNIIRFIAESEKYGF